MKKTPKLTKIVFQEIMLVDFDKEYKRINSAKWASKAQKERVLRLTKLFEQKKYYECYNHFLSMCPRRCRLAGCSEAEFAPMFIASAFGDGGFVDRIQRGQHLVSEEQIPLFLI